jgi:hypothetical protein
MALSDQLLKLSAQAEQLETSAAAVKAKDVAAIKKGKSDLEASIHAARIELGNEMEAANEQADSDWTAEKVDIAESFDALKQKRKVRHARWAAGRAGRAADAAEEDALDDIDFAIYTIEEAEYAILDAVNARSLADSKAEATR